MMNRASMPSDMKGGGKRRGKGGKGKGDGCQKKGAPYSRGGRR